MRGILLLILLLCKLVGLGQCDSIKTTTAASGVIRTYMPVVLNKEKGEGLPGKGIMFIRPRDIIVPFYLTHQSDSGYQLIVQLPGPSKGKQGVSIAFSNGERIERANHTVWDVNVRYYTFSLATILLSEKEVGLFLRMPVSTIEAGKRKAELSSGFGQRLLELSKCLAATVKGTVKETAKTP